MEGDPWPIKFLAIAIVAICLVMAGLAILEALSDQL